MSYANITFKDPNYIKRWLQYKRLSTAVQLSSNYFKKKERIIHEHIKKLNLVNFKYKKNKELKLLYKRDKLLVKYFDKYMENYYSDYKMINYRLINTDIHDYLLTNTLHLQRFNMRFHGYPMYLNCN